MLCGQEFWQIIAQWVWHLRLELGQQLQPTPMRLTEFAPAQAQGSAQAGGHCRGSPLRSQCQENATTRKPRRVSAVFWPLSSSPPAQGEPAALVVPPAAPVASRPLSPPCPVLWGDWERCQIRRSFLRLLRTQTLVLVPGSATLQEPEDAASKPSTN
jgi:hypothetical protein